MKRVIALLLLAVILFSLAGCSGGKAPSGAGSPSSEPPITTVDVMGYVLSGRFPEFEVGLGSLMGDVRASYADAGLSYSSLEGLHILSGDGNTFYMEAESYGVVAILTSDAVFGLSGNVTPEALSAHLGEPPKAGVPDLASLDPYGNVSGDKWAQEYQSGDNTAVFYYLSGKLYATLIYKTDSFALLGE